MSARMDTVDILIVVLYFLLVLTVGFLAMWRANRSTVSGYFLAGRSMNWMMIGASLFVSNIGSEHFIGLAGSGAASGLSVAAWELNGLLLLQLLGWVFIPVYIHSGVYTMPEYLAKRFGGRRLKVYFAALTLLLYIFTKLSVDLYSGALFIQESLGWDLYLSIILLISTTALMTVTGGLDAVIYTDVLQALLMISGALWLAVLSLDKVGGLEGVWIKYMQATPNVTAILLASPNNLTYSPSCHITPKPQSLKVLRGPQDPDLPWPGFILGQTPASIWYWCADQVIVQRVLAAKNIVHAKGATLMAGFLKILPMFIMVIPGMISRILFVDQLACISPEHCLEVCGSRAGCTNVAYPRLVMSVMPVGLRGLMMAVMIAALMSDLDSIFNSASTIFTLDIYKMARERASSWELMMVGRVCVVGMVVISIAWVPVVVAMQRGQMFYYIQEVSNYLTPPIAAIFLLGILWRRCNERGAFWGGMVGLVLGVTRLVLAFVYQEPLCDQPDLRPAFIKIHFMYVALVLFWVSGLVMVAVSLGSPPPCLEQIRSSTLWGLRHRHALSNADSPEEGWNAARSHDNESPTGHHNGMDTTTLLLGQTGNGHAGMEGQERGGGVEERGGGVEERGGGVEERGGGVEERSGGVEERGGGVEERGGGVECWRWGGKGSMWERALEWFCGCKEQQDGAQPGGAQPGGAQPEGAQPGGAQPGGAQPEGAQPGGAKQRRELEDMLLEPPRSRFLLSLALLLIITLGCFMFIYFSV